MANTLVPIPESKVILDLFNQQVTIQPHSSCLSYPTKSGFNEITYQQVYNAVHHAAHYFKQHGVEEHMIVGYVAPTEVEYQVNILALMQLGATPLTLSPRNSDQSMASLLKKADAKFIIYQESTLQLVKETQEIKDLNSILRPDLNTTDGVEILPSVKRGPEDITVIIHSSGSTSGPKLVSINHRNVMAIIDRERNSPYLGKQTNRTLSYGPLFHLYGLSSFWQVIARGSCLCLPSQSMGGAKSVMSDVAHYKPTEMNLLPFIAQNIIEYPDTDWSLLANLDKILIAGASFPQKHAKVFLDNGITVVNSYGSSETGGLANCRATKQDPRDYGRILTMCEGVKYDIINVTKESDGDEGQIMIKSDDPGLTPGFGDSDGYIISDRIKIVENTLGSFRFTILGRSDDVIVHTSGEKTNPIQIEEELASHQLISRAAIFLTPNKINTCVLIQLSENSKSIPVLSLISKVVSHVEKVNQSVPSHSRILSDYVHILPFNTLLPVTAKGNLKRAFAANQFSDVINSMGLENQESSHSQATTTTTNLDLPSINYNISNHFNNILSKEPDIEKSFFSQGLDSLTAVKFRSLINKSYPSTNLSINNVYEEDTILKLSSYIHAKLSGQQIHIKTLEEYQQEVDSTISRFTSFPKSNITPAQKRPNGAKLNVLITGANGSLGTFIIRSLFKKSEIGIIFGLARAGSREEAEKRVREGFSDRHVNLTEEQWSRFHNYPYVSDDEYLGMGKEDYDQVIPKIDIIYHVAWRMDFLKGLSQFEDLIQGTVNLLNISANSPFRPAFHFTSTVGAVVPLKFEQPIPEIGIHTNLKYVKACNGYNLSKLVSEVISQRYASHYRFSLNVYRVGQVGGDSESGAWNVREHLPLLIKAAQVMGVAPATFVPSVTWIPVDMAGQAMVDIHFTIKGDAPCQINHIANPHPVPWSDVLQMFVSGGLQFKVVPAIEFLELLKTPEFQDVTTNPAASLTDYFTNIFINPSHDLQISTIKTSQRSHSIQQCPPVHQEWINKYIKFWQNNQFLH